MTKPKTKKIETVKELNTWDLDMFTDYRGEGVVEVNNDNITKIWRKQCEIIKFINQRK